MVVVVVVVEEVVVVVVLLVVVVKHVISRVPLQKVAQLITTHDRKHLTMCLTPLHYAACCLLHTMPLMQSLVATTAACFPSSPCATTNTGAIPSYCSPKPRI